MQRTKSGRDKLTKWRKEGKHLPEFMRDFHDQKRLFKYIHDATDADKDGCGVNWRQAHVYTIDYFLWTMARHGYTLQRNRSNQPFEDLDECVQELEDSRPSLLDLRQNNAPTNGT